MNVISPLFCTFDRASQSYSPPFAAPHAGMAIRGFSDAISNPSKDTDISRHPDDFDLFEIGTFDSSTGRIVPVDFLDKPLVQGKQIAIQLARD